MEIAASLFGILTVVSACGVVFSRKPLNSALCLVVTLFLVAVHFALLDAPFLAAIQVLVYAGAIMVLVIFVIMLLGVEAEMKHSRLNFGNIGLVVAVCFFLWVVYGVVNNGFMVPTTPQTVVVGTTETIGSVLFTKYLVSFELAGVLLLAAIIGAVVLAHDEKRALKAGRGLKAKQR